jgi:CheY-like chemotaxis protein
MATLTPKTILLVSTLQDSLNELRTDIESHGARVVTARDGPEALEIAKQHIPDLVLLDVSAHIHHDLLSATDIRTDPELRHIPIVCVLADHETERNTPIALACDHVVKKSDLLQNVPGLIKELTFLPD